MPRLTLLLLALICSLPLVRARNIQGILLSSNDSTAVADAKCRLFSRGNGVAEGKTDANGAFSLQTSLKSALSLEISKEGFSSTEIIIEPGSGNLEIGTVYIDGGVTLQEVTVTGNQVVNSKGRTIVYPSGADVKASSTAISLFQKLPLAGLEANPINRSISVDGGTPMILINGVPSSMDDVNALQPKDIDKIEFSRVTPARYADSGKSGFLNITLKKRDDGGQVYAWGRSALNTAFVDGNFRAAYHQGPSQFTLMYFPSWRNYQKVYDTVEESYIGDGYRVDLKERSRNPFHYDYHTMKVKYDYSPSTKTLFQATFSINPSRNKWRFLVHTEDSRLGEYDNRNMSTNKDVNPSLDLFLRQDFNEKNSLEVQVVGTLSSSDYRRDNNYFYPDGSEDSYIMNVDSRRRSLISEVSYIHTFSQNTSLSTGWQNTVSRSTNTYLTSDYKPVLTENNNYAYVRLGQSVGKFYFSLSTGAKLFWMKNDLNKRHFVRNLSSAVVTWNINTKWTIQGVFRYSPYIPSLSALTDYPQQTSPYLVSNGNPDLKVAENYNFNLAGSFNSGKFSATLRSYYSNTRDNAVGDVSYMGDGLFLSQNVNSRYQRMFMNDVSMRLSDVHGFGGRLYLCLTRYWSAGDGWSHSLTSFDASLTVWWSKGPFTVSYWRKLPGKWLNGHVVGKEENGDALQVEWQPNEHWTIGASWMYMFDKKGTRYPSWNYSAVNPTRTEHYINDNANMVVLSVSYSADFGSIFRTGRRSLNNSDNDSGLLKL